MSEFQSDDFKQTRRVVVKTAARARGAGALVLSLLFFIPLVPLLGLFKGLAARRFNARSGVSGSAHAGSAVILGLLFTAAQGFVGYRGFDYYRHVTAGPGEAIAAGFDGDLASFASSFDTASPEHLGQASSFIDELRTRFGDFRSARLRGPIVGTSLGPWTYDLVFEKAIVTAEATTSFDTDWLKSELEYIVVQDPRNGDLAFPTTGAPMLTHVTDAD